MVKWREVKEAWKACEEELKSLPLKRHPEVLAAFDKAYVEQLPKLIGFSGGYKYASDYRLEVFRDCLSSADQPNPVEAVKAVLWDWAMEQTSARFWTINFLRNCNPEAGFSAIVHAVKMQPESEQARLRKAIREFRDEND